MQDRIGKRGARLGGLLLVAAAASVLALVFAGSGAAGVPPGVGCNFSDGQIAGLGATLQTRAQAAFIQGYGQDICGFSGSGHITGLNSVNNSMVDYNGINNAADAGVLTAPNGSGAGLRAVSCREVPFGGTDTPYTNANLANMFGTPGQQDTGPPAWWPNTPAYCPTDSTYLNPFYGTGAGQYPFKGADQAHGDQVASVMSYPVTGTAVTVDAFFGTPGTDSHGCPTTPQLTDLQVSALFGGTVTNWSDLGGAFASCFAGSSGSTPLPVRRVVRADSSGTSQNFKNFLIAVDGSATGAASHTCDGNAWSSAALSSNGPTNWPTVAGNGHASCAPLVTGVSSANASGNPGVLDTCVGINSGTTQDPGPVPGSVCYADLPDVENGPQWSALSLAELPAAIGGAFVDPFSGNKANCDFSSLLAPAGTSTGAVGLAPNDTWATNNPANPGNPAQHVQVANVGTGWPICAVTFDLVYKGLSQSASANSSTQPNQQLTDDMRRTLYSYMLYALGSGQAKMTSLFYQSLPQGLLNQEIAGFKANY